MFRLKCERIKQSPQLTVPRRTQHPAIYRFELVSMHVALSVHVPVLLISSAWRFLCFTFQTNLYLNSKLEINKNADARTTHAIILSFSLSRRRQNKFRTKLFVFIQWRSLSANAPNAELNEKCILINSFRCTNDKFELRLASLEFITGSEFGSLACCCCCSWRHNGWAHAICPFVVVCLDNDNFVVKSIAFNCLGDDGWRQIWLRVGSLRLENLWFH